MNYAYIYIIILILLVVPIFYIVNYIVTLFYRCAIEGRSLHSLKPTLYSWFNLFKSYSSHGRLIILKNPELPLGQSFNASLIVKKANGIFSNIINNNDDKVYMIFNNLLFTRKFACQVDYNTYDIQNCQWLRFHIYLHDGRMFNVNGKLYISFTKLDDNLVHKQSIYDVEKNIVYLPSFNYNSGKFRKEKNWQYFQQDKRLYMIYTITPFMVYEVDISNFEVIRNVKNEILNDKDKFRCSSPPIFVKDRYYMVIHSKNYRMFIMTFDKKFNVIDISSTPLCDTDNGICKYSIYFPCGMIYENKSDTFLISMGINDMTIGLMKYSKKEIDDILMNKDPLN